MSKQVQDSKNNEELVEAIARRIARDRYRYNMDGQPLSDKDRDKYAESDWRSFVDQATSALAVVKPEIEMMLREMLGLNVDNPVNPRLAMKRNMADYLNAFAKERGIDLEAKP